MSGIVYNSEKLTDELRREITPILEEHRVELSRYEDMILNPYWDKYRSIQDSDRLRIFTARDNVDDTILGYAVFILVENLHYMDFMVANEDVFYVVQDKRGSRIAYNLVKLTEKELKKDNVSTIVHHTKTSNRFGEFLYKLGYGLAEVMYHKRIDL